MLCPRAPLSTFGIYQTAIPTPEEREALPADPSRFFELSASIAHARPHNRSLRNPHDHFAAWMHPPVRVADGAVAFWLPFGAGRGSTVKGAVVNCAKVVTLFDMTRARAVFLFLLRYAAPVKSLQFIQLLPYQGFVVVERRTVALVLQEDLKVVPPQLLSKLHHVVGLGFDRLDDVEDSVRVFRQHGGGHEANFGLLAHLG